MSLMEAKSIIDDPQSAIANQWGSESACPKRDEITALAEKISELKAAIKKSKDNKGRISRQFREARGDAERIDALKREMAVVSGQLQSQEKECKNLEAQLLAHFDDKPPAPEPFPASLRHRCRQRDISPRVTVEQLDPELRGHWDDYVANHPGSSVYHLYAWKGVVERAFGHNCHYYVARQRDGRIVGVLPLVALKSRLFGHYAVSLPFFNYGGALADDRSIEAALLTAAGEAARSKGWKHIEYRRCDPELPLPSRDRKVSMILRLPDSDSELEDSLGAKVRAQVKQALRLDPTVRFGGVELLDDFYRVFARNMRDLGTPVYSKQFFREILSALPDRCTIVSVQVDGSPVAAAFLIGYSDMLEIPWASTLREYNSSNINMWMYRNILRFAIEGRYRYFDFGRSSEGAGTYKFKKQWGAKPLRHHWYYDIPGRDPETPLPELNPDNPKYRLAIRTWQKLPLPIANMLGPHIVKNLP